MILKYIIPIVISTFLCGVTVQTRIVKPCEQTDYIIKSGFSRLGDDSNIDTSTEVIDLPSFEYKLNDLYDRMVNCQYLSDIEVTDLICILNMNAHAAIDYKRHLDLKIPNLRIIDSIYNSDYKNYIHSMYQTSGANNGGTIFTELKVQLYGNMWKCKKFYVEDIMGFNRNNFCSKNMDVMEHLK